MKPYPSIQSSNGQKFQEFDAYVFDKIDGSNLRFEWTRKARWSKFGTRTRLFDHQDPDFGLAIPLFYVGWSEDLTRVAVDNRWDHLVVYMEFCGANSFAGKHDPDDVKRLTLFDACPNKKGLLGPKEFLKLFGNLHTPRLLSIQKWTRGFVDRIRKGESGLDVTFEGVVGKGGSGHELVMRKAKTKAWIDKVLAQYGETEGRKLVES